MMEEVVERENMRAAYRQVTRNAGAPGIDGLSVEEVGRDLRGEWSRRQLRIGAVRVRIAAPIGARHAQLLLGVANEQYALGSG